MELTKQDEIELKRIADQMDSIAQKVREFKLRHSDLRGIKVTPEYMTLLTMFSRVKVELESIPY